MCCLYGMYVCMLLSVFDHFCACGVAVRSCRSRSTCGEWMLAPSDLPNPPHTLRTVDVNVLSVIKEYAEVLHSHNTCMQIRNDRVARRKHGVLPVCFLPGSWCSVWPGWGLLHPGASPEESPDEECRCTGSHPPRAHTNKTNVAVRQVY